MKAKTAKEREQEMSDLHSDTPLACACVRDLMGMGSNTCTGSTLRSRAGVRERFYDPAIASDGENRRLSIRKVPMTTYFRARNALLEFFVGA